MESWKFRILSFGEDRNCEWMLFVVNVFGCFDFVLIEIFGCLG